MSNVLKCKAGNYGHMLSLAIYDLLGPGLCPELFKFRGPQIPNPSVSY